MTLRVSTALICASTMTIAAAPAAAGDSGAAFGGLQIGGMAVVAPKYEGSKDYEVRGFPILAPSGTGNGDGVVQFRGPDDLRLRLLTLGGFEAGPLAGWRFGREEDDAARLAGLGDVDGGLIGGAFAAYRFGGLMPFVSYHHQVTGDDTGGLLRLGVEARVPVWESVRLTATAGATWASEDYMDAYFSVTPAQAAASTAGLGAFDADSGFKDVYVGASADVPLYRDWSLKLSARYAHLIGDAGSSPIAETIHQFSGGIGLTYRFDLRR